MNVKHGGHILPADAAGARSLARTLESATLDSNAGTEAAVETSFDYLFPALAEDPSALLPADEPLETVAGLKALGDAMVEQAAAAGDGIAAQLDSTIPAVYTYWGQFIDHDLTANTDSNIDTFDITKADLAPIAPADVVAGLKNARRPALNLDSLYGDGPAFAGQVATQAAAFYDGIRFKIGQVATSSDIPGVRIPPVDDLARDLPRISKKAQIADSRNDENLIIAQLHTAFLRFHNNVVQWLEDAGYLPDQATFEHARQLTRWHYQWLVMHDYLKTVTLAGTVDKVLLGGLKYYRPAGEPFMPLEFSVAAFRFGHTMVRGAYDHCRNFGRPGADPETGVLSTPLIPFAPFDLLFQFTGNGFPTPFPQPGTTDTLPFNWVIEWDRFVDHGSSLPDHYARKIDTLLAPPLRALVNEANAPEVSNRVKHILKRLARRNLLRGYLLSIPTGQCVADAMGIERLSEQELRQGNSSALNDVLVEHGFLERTPLWYYILKEAEVRANGNSLGALGSRIVCETLIGQLFHDQESYIHHVGGWDPGQGVKLPNGDPIVTIADFIRFAGLPA